MIRVQHPLRAGLGIAVLCLSGLGAVSGATGAHGTPIAPSVARAAAPAALSSAALGSGLGAIDGTATATAVRLPLYSHQGEDVEAEIPYSLATLTSGGVGEGLTSVVYPGGTGAHGGDTLNLLGISGIPTSVAQDLNDPEVASAQTGVGSPTVSKSNPGVTMKAIATATHVNGHSALGGSGVPVIGSIIGSSKASSDIRVTGPKRVVAKASSTIHSLSIAKVITIGAITSSVSGASNGHTSSGHATTKVAGVKIAGVPVTITSSGIHIKGNSIPLLGDTVSKVVNTALKTAGISLKLTGTTKKIHGAHVKLTAGALEIKLGNKALKKNVNDSGDLLSLGGASVDLIASPGFPPPAAIKPVKIPKTPVTKTPTSVPPAATGGSGGSVPPVATPPSTPSVATAPVTGSNPILAADPLKLPKTMKVWWVIVALLGAGVFAFGMKRLPDEVLAASGDNCRIEEV